MKRSFRPYQFSLLFVLLILFGVTISAQRILDALPSSVSKTMQLFPYVSSHGKPETAPSSTVSSLPNALETAQSGGSFEITQSVIPGGGGLSAGGNNAITGSLGQVTVGASSGGNFAVAGGFWGGASSGGCTTITVTPPATTSTTVGANFSQSFTQSGGMGMVTFSTVSPLPPGLTLAANGTLSGIPSQAGTFPITITATDMNNCTGSANYTLNVQSGACPITVSVSTTLTGATASNLTVPIIVSNLTGQGVISYQFTVTFDTAVLQLQTPPLDSVGTLSSAMTLTPNTTIPGQVTVAAFGVNSLSGAGTLLNLKFNVVGTGTACSGLNWTNFVFNEGTPCALTSNGQACVGGAATISGTVSYCVMPTAKVPGVTVSTSDVNVLPNTTGPAGDYLLTGFGTGPVTVTPTKLGGGSGISSFDASLVAQYAANLLTLNSCQQAAGDGSNNGSLSSFDASLIAQYAAGITNPSSVVNTWKFVPANRTYASVNGNLIGQDYNALLIGDVSGNWLATGSAPSRVVAQVPISLPDLSATTGANLTIPITVGNLTGLGIVAYDFDLMFDPSVLQLIATPIDASGTLSNGMTITANPSAGRLRISAFGINALNGGGTLLNLKVSVVGSPGTATTLNWQNFLFNEEMQNSPGNGSVTVTPSTSGLQFYPLAHPIRLLDTRTGQSGCDAPGAMIPGQTSRVQTAAGRTCDGLTIPANAKALTGNITTVQSGGGFLTLYPSDVTRPLVANSNFTANQVLNNVFTVGLGSNDGAFNIFVTTDTNVVVDITGYYAQPSSNGLYFHPLPKPVRLLDTRTGQTACFTPGAALTADSTRTQLGTTTCDGVQIPAETLALVGNATTVGPQANGFLTLFPANASRPLAANSNYQSGLVMNAPFTVGLSPSGEFSIYTAASTDLVLDVLGYYSTQSNDTNGQGLLFSPLPTPVRLLDTRIGQTGCFTPGAQMASGTVYTQPAIGACTAIPATAKAVVGNATTVNVSANGFLTFWPSDTSQPNVSTSNYRNGTVFNRHFTVGLGSNGDFKRFASSATDLVIDLSGYFAP